jgi:hypothetical protein
MDECCQLIPQRKEIWPLNLRVSLYNKKFYLARPSTNKTFIIKQKKKEEEKAKDKELNDLFKIAVSQPKVPLGNHLILWFFSACH